MASDYTHLVEWLMAEAGPIVRYQTAVQLIGGLPASEMWQLQSDLLAHPTVRSWLSRLTLGDLLAPGETLADIGPRQVKRLVNGQLHGSRPTAIENVLGKLAELGLHAGMAALDECMAPFNAFLQRRLNHCEFTRFLERIVASIIAWGLLRSGYGESETMQEFAPCYVALIHPIAADGVYEIHADESELAGLPKAWAGKPILRPAIMDRYYLPLIHDLYVFAYLPSSINVGVTAQQINDIVSYVLDPRFQALPDGFGYGWDQAKRTCYSWGWSPHLPGYAADGFDAAALPASAVQRIELMARFPFARRTRWFQEAVQHLESFRTDRGTYCFPASYLREEPSGYYVSGYYMGLGENRRSRQALEIESTFRMLRLKKLIRS